MTNRQSGFVCTIEDIMPSPDEQRAADDYMETWLLFHPEDAVVDPHEMDTYGYFHPETWGEWVGP